jgi:uncharacterized membrane protein YraQ (UPF0718 family)
MSKTLLAEIRRARTRSLALVPLLIVTALFVYKANASFRVLSSTWATGTEFISMLMVQFLPASLFQSPGANFLVILMVSTIVLPLALPTFLEIPLALSLLAAGFSQGAAVALLFAGPAVNLPSLWSVARVSGWKVAGTVAASIWAISVLGGRIA